MSAYAGKHALVLGRDASGDAAAAVLRSRGARVSQAAPEEIRPPDAGDINLLVLSAGCWQMPAMARVLAARGIPVVGERELAFQECLCLHVAIAGANGKSTTAELTAHLLRSAGRRVEVACGPDRPASAFVNLSRELDFLVHGVEACELEHFRFFRPVVAALLNAPEEAPEAGGAWADGLPLVGRLFSRQQAFDWAIVQSEALARMHAVGAVPPGKIITFSACSRQADLSVERGLLVSRLEGWSGPLWDLDRGRIQGGHLAENVLAALAIGRVLRLTLDEMTLALRGFKPGRGRFEDLGTAGGVRFVDDGRCRNLRALSGALRALAPVPPEDPFIWLLSGGAKAGRSLYDLGPLLSPRVKQALVWGEAAPAMRAAWSLFTPCSAASSLLDAANRAVKEAVSGDTILYSPACPRRAQPAEPPETDDVFRQLVELRLQGGSEVTADPGPAAGPGAGSRAGGSAVRRSPRHSPIGTDV